MEPSDIQARWITITLHIYFLYLPFSFESEKIQFQKLHTWFKNSISLLTDNSYRNYYNDYIEIDE